MASKESDLMFSLLVNREARTLLDGYFAKTGDTMLHMSRLYPLS